MASVATAHVLEAHARDALRAPERGRVHHQRHAQRADELHDAAQWLGHVRVTTVARTLADCIAAHVSPSYVEQALAQARRRKLLSVSAHARLRHALTRSR